jgi:glycosyltransferase involved in cell wall biosynthesis
MNILLVHNSYQRPGGEDVAFEQERQLLIRGGHHVVTYRRSNLEIEGYSLLQRLALVKDVVWAADTRREFARLLLKEKPQLVHIHNTFVMASPSIYSACHEARVPVVQTLHNYRLLCPAATFFRDGRVCRECVDHSLWRGIRYGCYRGSRAATATVAFMLEAHRWRGTWVQVDSYVTLSNFARGVFVHGGLPADKIFVKPNFVYPDPGARRSAGEYALFVGRLSPEKGVRMLVTAWERLRKRIPLVIVGDGPLRAELEARIARGPLSGVSFAGHLGRDQVLAAMKQARFVIVPSECYENFPATICEAFACGVPVICTRLGAMEELVKHDSTGLHFDPGDPEDLAAKAEWAWDHSAEMELMGQEARNEYAGKYTSERNYEMLMEIYQRTIGRLDPSCVYVNYGAVVKS